MAGEDGTIKSSQVVEADKLVADLGKIIHSLNEMNDVIENKIRKNIPAIQSLNPTNAAELKKSEAALKDYNAELEKKIKTEKTLKQLQEEQTKARVNSEKIKQAELKTQKEKISLSQQQLKSDKELNKVIADETKEKIKNAKATYDANSVYRQSVLRLSELKKELKELSISGKTNTEEYKKLTGEFSALDKKVRTAEQSVGEFHRSVGNYRNELKQLMVELSHLEPGSDGFLKAAEKAAHFKHEVELAEESVNNLVKTDKVGALGDQFSEAGEKLESGNFKGASTNVKQFSLILKSISFKSIIGGVKSFGSALLQLGKTIISNPIFLLAAVIVAVVYETYKAVEAFMEFNDATEALKKSNERLEDSLGKLKDRYKVVSIEIQEALGKISKKQAELSKLDVANNRERIELNKEYAKQIIDLADETNVNPLTGETNNNFAAIKNGQVARVLNEQKFQRDLLKIKANFSEQAESLLKNQNQEINLINAKATEEELKKEKEKWKEHLKIVKDAFRQLEDLRVENIRDEETRERAKVELDYKRSIESVKEKHLSKDQEYNLLHELQIKFLTDDQKITDKFNSEREAKEKEKREKILEEQKRTDKAIQEIQSEQNNFSIDQLQKEIDKEKSLGSGSDKEKLQRLQDLLNRLYALRAKAIIDKAKQDKEGTDNDAEKQLIENKMNDDLARLSQDKSAELTDLKKKALDEQFMALKENVNKSIELIDKALAKESELRVAAYDRDIQQRQRNITLQQQLAANGKKNTLAFEEEKLRQDERKKVEEQKKQVKIQKELALLKLIAGYAEKGDPAQALGKALVDIGIEAVYAAAFKDGVEKLDGPGTETSDDIYARLSKNESVITAKGTKENPGLATAMNKGNVDEYFEKKLLPDYFMNFDVVKTTGENIYASLQLQQLSELNKKIESVEQAIKKIPQVQFDVDGFGNIIKKTTEDGMQQVVKFMFKKPRL